MGKLEGKTGKPKKNKQLGSKGDTEKVAEVNTATATATDLDPKSVDIPETIPAPTTFEERKLQKKLIRKKRRAEEEAAGGKPPKIKKEENKEKQEKKENADKKKEKEEKKKGKKKKADADAA